MKTLIKFPAMMLGLLLGIAGTTESAKAQYDDVSLQTFYDELSPYGTWINDPEYGYVWRPDVDQEEFRPYYSNGRWAMTEYGNTWVSNYDWGWTISTMAVGFTIGTIDGFGYQTPFGDLLG